MSSVIAFRQKQKVQDWSNAELAELYRVVDILSRAGVAIDTDKGLSDEGDPWFVFCRADTGDVIVHFARIGNQFVAVSAVTDDVVRGPNFRKIAEALVNRQPLVLPAPAPGQKLFLHPSVLLTALVATTLAQMKSWDGKEFAVSEQMGEAAPVKSLESLTETLKSTVMDALHILFRSGPYPGDLKPGHSENAHANVFNTPGLGLGNLSLASVVAFAISVIQGSISPDEDGVTRLAGLSQDGGDVSAKSASVQASAPPAWELHDQQMKHDKDNPIEIREQAPVKATPRETVVVEKGEKLIIADEADQAAGGAKPALQELPASQLHADAGVAHMKPAAHQAEVKEAQAERTGAPEPVAVLFTPPKEMNTSALPLRFNFSEISREAIEILFVSVSGGNGPSSDGRQIALVNIEGRLDGGDNGISAAPARTEAIKASDIVFAGGNPEALSRLNVITNFVNSTASEISGPVTFSDALSSYWSGDKALTLVVFDSNNLPLNIFSFTNNVLFIEDSQVKGFDAAGHIDSAVHLDLANGGEVTLLGVINLPPIAHA